MPWVLFIQWRKHWDHSWQDYWQYKNDPVQKLWFSCWKEIFTEPQNDQGWLDGTHQYHPAQARSPTAVWAKPHAVRIWISVGIISITSLGNLCQCVTTNQLTQVPTKLTILIKNWSKQDKLYMSMLPDLGPHSFKGEILILFHCEVVKVSSVMLAFGDTKEASATCM